MFDGSMKVGPGEIAIDDKINLAIEELVQNRLQAGEVTDVGDCRGGVERHQEVNVTRLGVPSAARRRSKQTQPLYVVQSANLGDLISSVFDN